VLVSASRRGPTAGRGTFDEGLTGLVPMPGATARDRVGRAV